MLKEFTFMFYFGYMSISFWEGNLKTFTEGSKSFFNFEWTILILQIYPTESYINVSYNDAHHKVVYDKQKEIFVIQMDTFWYYHTMEYYVSHCKRLRII